MKKICYLLFGLFMAYQCHAQPISWQWARCGLNYNNGYGPEGFVVTTDRSSSVLMAGSYSGNCIFGDDTLAGTEAEMNYLVVKYDSAGNFQWARSCIEYSGYTVIWGISTDENNNVYVAGYFSDDSIIIANIVLHKSAGSEKMLFTASYDALGNVRWAKTFGSGNGFDNIQGIATDLNSNVYITGDFGEDTVIFGSSVLHSSNGFTGFIAKYDSAGNEIWARCPVGGDGDESDAVTTDAFGNVIISGVFGADSIMFGDLKLYGSSLQQQSIFTVEYNSSGAALWATAAYCPNLEPLWGNPLAADAEGNIYLAGAFVSDSMVFDTVTLYSIIPDSTFRNSFIVKYNSAGQFLWAKRNDYGNAEIHSIAAYNDKIYISGSMNYNYTDSFIFDGTAFLQPPGSKDPMFVLITDSNAHLIQGTVLISGGVNPNGICVDQQGNACITACLFVDSMVIADDTLRLQHPNTTNYFVAKLNGNPHTCSSGPDTVNISGDTLSVKTASAYQWYFNGSSLPGDTTNRLIAIHGGNYSVQITDTYGCVDTAGPVLITDIKNELSEININVFPNPTSTGWQLNVGPQLIGSMAKVFDATGRLVYQSQISNQYSTLSIANLASGVYELRITSGNYYAVRKLVKM